MPLKSASDNTAREGIIAKDRDFPPRGVALEPSVVEQVQPPRPVMLEPEFGCEHGVSEDLSLAGGDEGCRGNAEAAAEWWVALRLTHPTVLPNAPKPQKCPVQMTLQSR